jgi:hypothetical protein
MKKRTLLLLALPMAAHSSANNYYDYEYKYVDQNGMRQVTAYSGDSGHPFRFNRTAPSPRFSLTLFLLQLSGLRQFSH